MISLTDDLRCHISRSSTCILCVVWLDLPRNPQICDSQVATIIKHQVFWLEITMDNLAGMHVFEAEHDASQKEASFFFFEFSAIAQMVAQISSIAVIHHKEQVFPILERVDHVDQKGILQFLQQRLLIHHRMHGPLRHNLHLLHFLHSIHSSRALLTHLPYFPESTLSHHKIQLERADADPSRVLSFVIFCIALVRNPTVGPRQVVWLVAGPEIPQSIEVDMPMSVEKLQEVANQKLLVFFLAGRGRKQAVLSGRPGLVLYF